MNLYKEKQKSKHIIFSKDNEVISHGQQHVKIIWMSVTNAKWSLKVTLLSGWHPNVDAANVISSC